MDGTQDVPWRDYENISGNYVGTGLTSVLPKSEILYGESTHSYASLNEDGIEGEKIFMLREPYSS